MQIYQRSSRTSHKAFEGKRITIIFEIYPDKFQNKTNGITQRRFLRLCNPKYSALITELLGSDEWINDLSRLKELEKFAQNKDVLERFIEIKKKTKRNLQAIFV